MYTHMRQQGTNREQSIVVRQYVRKYNSFIYIIYKITFVWFVFLLSFDSFRSCCYSSSKNRVTGITVKREIQ